jgi:lysophospholipase L1-like esterase
MKRRIVLGMGLFLGLALIAGAAWLLHFKYRVDADDPTVWESDVQAFEATDRDAPPPKDAIVFVGSSSFALWESLEADMAPLVVINRGFGGSKIPDITHYLDRVVLPYQPRALVFYAGDNDMAAGKVKTPQEVLSAFQEFLAELRKTQPELPVFFVSIKPSQLRWAHWPKMQEANALIQTHAVATPGLFFVDVGSAMLDQNGAIKEGVYGYDPLHMAPAGYALWTQTIKAALEQGLKAPEKEP